MKSFAKSFGLRLVIRVAIVAIVALGFLVYSYFGIGNSGSLSATKKIQKAYPELSSYSTGDLELASMYAAYDYSSSPLDTFEGTAEEMEQIEAMMEMGDILHANIPNVSDSTSNGVTGAYLGTMSGDTVDGLYVLEFKDGLTVDQTLIDKAHELQVEYYFIQGKYLVVFSAEFAEMNDIDITSFGEKLSEIL